MEPGVNIFLPFRWIAEHPPQGTWTMEEIHFNSAPYMEKCTKFKTGEFSLILDESVAKDLSA